jgi:NAD-dependent DNA ligase
LSFSSSKTQNSTEQLFNILKSYKREMLYEKSFRFKGPFKSGIKNLGLNYAKDLVKTLGGKINDTSAKTLSYFITNRPKSRYLKFQEMGIEILTEQEFFYLLEEGFEQIPPHF